MPYMQCNGRTVSRHNTTPEVEKCKLTEQTRNIEVYASCTADKECLADRESRDAHVEVVAWIGIVALSLVMIGLFKFLWDDLMRDLEWEKKEARYLKEKGNFRS